jgi:Protein of unknown function (DUF3558).
MRELTPSFALAIITLAAVVSCGRGQQGKVNEASPATPPATALSSEKVSVDPCSLVTKAEAEAFFGAPLSGPEHPDGKPDQCVYKNESGYSFLIGVSGPSTVEAVRQLGAMMPHARAVSGVGDAAYEYPSGTINFVKGSTLCIVDANIPRWGDEKLLNLAKTAAGRL